MSDVSIVPVDERDSGWEDHRPRFRVYLHGSGESSTGGWTATYDVTGADVLQVVDWAQAQAGDSRTYAVALVYDDRAKEKASPAAVGVRAPRTEGALRWRPQALRTAQSPETEPPASQWGHPSSADLCPWS